MICSSANHFFTSKLLVGQDWTPNRRATQNRGDFGFKVLQVLAENSYASTLVTNATRDGKVIYANKAFKTLTVYDPHEAIGKTP